MYQAKYFQKTLGVINTILPGYGEDYIWDTVYSPGLRQSWKVDRKTEEMER